MSRFRRKSRMVEISKSGSGEGLGWETGRGYSTTVLRQERQRITRPRRGSQIRSSCRTGLTKSHEPLARDLCCDLLEELARCIAKKFRQEPVLLALEVLC